MQKIALLGCAAVVILILFVGGVLLVMGIGSYNRLVTLSTDVDTKWAQVETDYQRRADLIPNLVRTEKCGGDEFWQSVVGATMGPLLKEGRYTEAIAAAIAAVGRELAAHFPRAAGQAQENELPDDIAED